MASNQTTNYGLNQWEATDQVLRTDFNQDNAKLDAALKALADKEAELEGTLAGQAAAISKLGTCSMEHFTYRGNGTYGSENPTQVTFSSKPYFFIILGSNCGGYGSKYMDYIFLNLYDNNSSADTTWSGNTLSFHASGATWQLNTKSQTYHVFAFYDMSQQT